jgi:hypothetical protein
MERPATLRAMKRIIALSAIVLLTTFSALAADKFEYGIIKWDGPDRIYYNMPNKFELVYLTKQGVKIPKDAQGEEFCLAWAMNQASKEGWEAVNLNSRRILVRRAIH